MVNPLLSVAASAVLALAEVWSWVIWGALALVVLVVELVAVFTEKRTGLLPLTRVVRDRLMKKSKLARLGVLFFLTWLLAHFIIPEAGF